MLGASPANARLLQLFKFDKIQSALLNAPNLSADQSVRLMELVRTRRKHYESRSKYLRPFGTSGGFQMVFAYGVTRDVRTGTWTRINSAQPTARRRRLNNRSDSGTRKALQKLRQLDTALRVLLNQISESASKINNGSPDVNRQLRALGALIKIEGELLTLSCDP